MISAGKKTDPGQQLRLLSRETALRAVERLKELLEDPDASPADVLKASTLVFERIYPAVNGGDSEGGDFEICVKEA